MGIAALLKDPKALFDGSLPVSEAEENIEEGLSFLSYAHGVVTAVAVSPETIPVSEWMPLLIGPEQEQEDGRIAEHMKVLMEYQYRKVLQSLTSSKETYEPFFCNREEDDPLISRDWASGFWEGVNLRWDAWQRVFEGENGVLKAMLSSLLQDENALAAFKKLEMDSEKMIAEAQEATADIVQFLYDNSPRRMRGGATLPAAPADRVGRNDPCPCGSGKKYKKCCLN